MPTASNLLALAFYPAYTFPASPTWFAWVKLTCYQIHHDLQSHPDYTSALIETTIPNSHAKPLLLVHLNHPIHFIQTIGIIVAIEEYNTNFWLCTLDDSSGCTLDVLYWRPKPQPPADKENVHSTTTAPSAAEPGVDESNILTLLPTLTIGTCIQAKGLITQFRGTRQLALLRLSIVPTTTSELGHIQSRTKFYTEVLSKPWILANTRLSKLRKKSEQVEEDDEKRVEKGRKRARMALEREARHQKAILREYEEEEKLREVDAGEAREDGKKVMSMIRRKRRRESMDEGSDDD